MALSVQVRSIWEDELAVATRSVGSAGAGGSLVVSQDVFEKFTEGVTPLKARTR